MYLNDIYHVGPSLCVVNNIQLCILGSIDTTTAKCSSLVQREPGRYVAADHQTV